VLQVIINVVAVNYLGFRGFAIDMYQIKLILGHGHGQTNSTFRKERQTETRREQIQSRPDDPSTGWPRRRLLEDLAESVQRHVLVGFHPQGFHLNR
jgi:hypothetical protein